MRTATRRQAAQHVRIDIQRKRKAEQDGVAQRGDIRQPLSLTLSSRHCKPNTVTHVNQNIQQRLHICSTQHR